MVCQILDIINVWWIFVKMQAIQEAGPYLKYGMEIIWFVFKYVKKYAEKYDFG